MTEGDAEKTEPLSKLTFLEAEMAPTDAEDETLPPPTDADDEEVVFGRTVTDLLAVVTVAPLAFALSFAPLVPVCFGAFVSSSL